jgi:hypothetical protein
MSWFKHPKKRYLYAVTGGKYLGELLVFMEKTNESFSFLTLPDMKIREVPYDKFEFGLTNKIVDIVEKLPSDVYSTCKKQYLKNRLM